MFKRWSIVLILAGLTGILTLGFLSGLANRVPVVVATHALAVGQTIGEADVELRQIHASAAHPDALHSVEEVIGRRLGQTRLTDDQITESALAGADNPLVPALKSGQRAMAVKVTDNQGLLGTLRPGDAVSVIGVNTKNIEGSQSRVLLSQLRVLLVSYDFRYSEPETVTPSEQGNLTSVSASSRQRVREGVVVLAVPVQPISITVGISSTVDISGSLSTVPIQVLASPVEVLALLNNDPNTQIHLALEPAGALSAESPGVEISDLFPERDSQDDSTVPPFIPFPASSNTTNGDQP